MNRYSGSTAANFDTRRVDAALTTENPLAAVAGSPRSVYPEPDTEEIWNTIPPSTRSPVAVMRRTRSFSE